MSYYRRNYLYPSLFMVIMFAISILSMLVLGAILVLKSINYDRNCGGYLKRAADASTIQIAKEELGRAVKYMEANGLTNGYTSVIYTSPDEDVGFWYKNIKMALQELENFNDEKASPVDRSNQLIKLRETLLDRDGITAPTGISKFPSNATYFWWFLISAVFCAVSLGLSLSKGIDT